MIENSDDAVSTPKHSNTISSVSRRSNSGSLSFETDLHTEQEQVERREDAGIKLRELVSNSPVSVAKRVRQ